MQRKIVYLINPISGTRLKSSLENTVIKATEKQGIAFEIIPTNAEGNYSFLREKITSEKITDVVICGGDGSISAVSGALIGLEINTGIIPMGSGNGLALCAGISRKTNKALDIIFKGKASYIDGFYINGKFSCMLSGIGMDAAVAHDFARQKKRGLKTYLKLSLAHYLSDNPYHFDIITEERSFSAEAFLISIANSNQFGNNFKIAPQASLSDGLLDIVIVKKRNKLLLPFSFLRQINGFNTRMNVLKGIRKKNILYFQKPSLTIVNRQLAPLHIDGDPKETAESFEIKVVRNAIKLIQG